MSPTNCPKELLGHNSFDKSSHWDTPRKTRVRKKPTDVYVYVSTMNSPASTIDSPIALAARATNLFNSNEECEQTYIGSCVVVNLLITIKELEW